MVATNLPDILDPALTRLGRFDRHVSPPTIGAFLSVCVFGQILISQGLDVKGRQEILELYLEDKPMCDDIYVKGIVRATPGFNVANLVNLVNIVAIKVAVEGADKLIFAHLEYAKDKILMDTEHKKMFLTEE
ncbi:hypothetical protein V6N13_108611 [Hibiscus sabdariffa]